MSSVHIDLTDALNKIKVNSQEVLESVMRKALTRSCVRIRDEARRNHPRWKNRTGALEKAITYRFIRKWKEAEVYVSENKLFDELDKRATVLDSYKTYEEGEDVGRDAIFLDKYRNYADYLIKGTNGYSSDTAKTLRFVGKDGKIHFRKKVDSIKGHNWLKDARRRVNIGDIVREVLDEYGFKHN